MFKGNDKEKQRFYRSKTKVSSIYPRWPEDAHAHIESCLTSTYLILSSISFYLSVKICWDEAIETKFFLKALYLEQDNSKVASFRFWMADATEVWIESHLVEYTIRSVIKDFSRTRFWISSTKTFDYSPMDDHFLDTCICHVGGHCWTTGTSPLGGLYWTTSTSHFYRRPSSSGACLSSDDRPSSNANLYLGVPYLSECHILGGLSVLQLQSIGTNSLEEFWMRIPHSSSYLFIRIQLMLRLVFIPISHCDSLFEPSWTL